MDLNSTDIILNYTTENTSKRITKSTTTPLDDHFYKLFDSYEMSAELGTIETIILTLLFLTGIIGNTLSIRIFHEKNSLNFNKYFKYLSIMDTLFISLQYTTMIFLKFDYTSTFLTSFYCKYYLFSLFWILQSSILLLVLININQVVSILLKLRNSQVEQSQRVLKLKKFFHANSIFIQSVVLAILNIPNIYYTNVYILRTTISSSYLFCGINMYYDAALNVINIIFFSVLPYILILSLTIGLLVLIAIPNARYKTLLKQTGQYQYVLITVFMDIFYLISFFLLIFTILSTSNDDGVSLEVLFQISLNANYMTIYLLIFIYNSFKIIIYACFYQVFREKLRIMIFQFKNKCRFHRYRQQNDGIDDGRREANVLYRNNRDEIVIMQRNF
jgi:hypothetical protein